MQTVTLTYTHATLSIASDTFDSPSLLGGARRNKHQPDVVYTPSSHHDLETLISAFYTAAVGTPPAPSTQRAETPTTGTGTILRAAYEGLGSFIDILA